jgi:hypothetical protein
MPPEEEEQPTEGEIASVIAHLDSRIGEGRAARMAARPAVAHYRLSRQEYQNTAYDLLGVRYNPKKPGELNEDPRWHGFERVGKETGEETNEGLIELDIPAPEDEPQIYQFEVFLEMPTSLNFNVVATDIIDRQKGGHYRNAFSQPFYMFTHSSETHLLNPSAPKMFDDDGNGIYSSVLLDWNEWEGPPTESDFPV